MTRNPLSTSSRLGALALGLTVILVPTVASVAQADPAGTSSTGASSTSASSGTGSSSAEPSADPTTDPEKTAKACARAKTWQQRIDKIVHRYQGDADTVGSLAWVKAKADGADNEKRSQRIDRFAVRMGNQAKKITTAADRLDTVVEKRCS